MTLGVHTEWTGIALTALSLLSRRGEYERGGGHPVTSRILRTACQALLLVLVVATLAGCKFYWSKPAGTVADFNRDSLECVKESSPTPEAAKYGVPSEKIYKACLRQRGWVRENGPGGEGFFRGIEDFD